MNIDRSNLLNLISNLAILVGLLFLGFEMRHNSLTTAAIVHHSEGLMSDRIWRAWDAWNIDLVGQGPGYRTWWDSSRLAYDEEFGLHVDEVFSRAH